MRHTALTICLFYWSTAALSQRSLTSFGLYTETHLLAAPSSVALLAAPGTAGQPHILVSSSTTPVIQEMQMEDESHLHMIGRVQAPFPIARLGTVDLEGDRRQEIVALAPDGRRIALLKPHGRRQDTRILELHQQCERFVAADINNDGHSELLLFGKSMTGVSVISTQGKNLKELQLLFPDISVGDMAVVDLNQDGVADVVLCQWLSNRLLVRFGIGSGIFSDQASLDLPAEPDRMSLITVSRRRMMRVLVTLPELHGVAHIYGYPSGELAVRDVIKLPDRPTGVKFSLVNDDFLPDMICSTTAGFVVSLGSSALTFAGQTVFGAGQGAASWTLGDANGVGLTDLVFVENPDRLAVLSNARTVPGSGNIYTYACGAEPVDVFVGDCNGDGTPDIVTANYHTKSLSFFNNLNDGTFDGQRSVELQYPPSGVLPVRPFTGGRRVLLAVHADHSALSLVQVPFGSAPPRIGVIPTGPEPEVVLAEGSPASDPLRILLYYRGITGGDSPLGLVEQLDGTRYVERGYRWPQATSIATIAAGHVTGNAHPDLVMALRDRRSHGTTFVVAPSLEGFDVRRAEPIFSLPDTAGVPRFIATEQRDNDRLGDAVIFLGPPTYQFGLARVTPGRSLQPPVQWQSGIGLIDFRDVILMDADQDRAADIVFRDRKEESVKVLYGNGRGAFSKPVVVGAGPSVSAFAVGPVFHRETADLVTTNNSQHTVTIHRGVFRR